MSQVRKIAMFGGTFAVALGIGFVMQNGDALAARFGTEDELRAAQAQVQSQTETSHFIVLDALPEEQIVTEEETRASADLPLSPVLPDLPEPQTASVSGIATPQLDAKPESIAPPVQVAAADPDTIPMTDATPIISDEMDCTPTMSAEVGRAAMVTLSIEAPCNTDTRGTLHHQGMMFTFLTDSEGDAVLTVPALAQVAVFIADISNGEGAMSMVDVPDMAMYDRAVLQWQGATGLELHAREFGANYGEDGHVWHDASREMTVSIENGEGFLVQLGDAAAEEALMAEVYTFPSGATAQEGNVRLSAEVEITDQNCGRNIAAQSLQIGPEKDTSALDLTLTLPACDATGDFLVLQNMFEDLRLASR